MEAIGEAEHFCYWECQGSCGELPSRVAPKARCNVVSRCFPAFVVSFSAACTQTPHMCLTTIRYVVGLHVRHV